MGGWVVVPVLISEAKVIVSLFTLVCSLFMDSTVTLFA
jgi:hypothetical protein